MSTMYNLVIVGDGGVGKSALSIQLIKNYFVAEYDPTIENSYRKQLEVDGQTCMLDILDTAGQEALSAMTDAYMLSGNGFMIVYSILSRLSLEEGRRFYDKIKLIKDEDDVPIVLVANKCDLEKMREVSRDTGAAVAEEFKCPFFETSAKDRINVDEAFMEAIREMRKYADRHEKLRPTEIVGIGGSSGKKGGKVRGFRCVLL